MPLQELNVLNLFQHFLIEKPALVSLVTSANDVHTPFFITAETVQSIQNECLALLDQADPNSSLIIISNEPDTKETNTLLYYLTLSQDRIKFKQIIDSMFEREVTYIFENNTFYVYATPQPPDFCHVFGRYLNRVQRDLSAGNAVIFEE